MLESTDNEMSLSFEMYILEFPLENVSVLVSGNYFISKLKENVKRALKYLKICWCTYEVLSTNYSISYRSNFVLISS